MSKVKNEMEVYTDWDEAKADIEEHFGCNWDDLTLTTQVIFKDVFDAGRLKKTKEEA